MTCFTRPRIPVKAAVSGVALLLMVEVLTGCVPVVVGAGVVTTATVINDRRPFKRIVEDNTLELQLRAAYRKEPAFDGSNISVTVFNGVVLLTGEISTDELRQKAEGVARDNVKIVTVVNEIELSGTTSLTSRANDALITAKVKTSILASSAGGSNIKVVTENGKVFLMGLVTEKEADAAVNAAQRAGGATYIIKVFEIVE